MFEKILLERREKLFWKRYNPIFYNLLSIWNYCFFLIFRKGELLLFEHQNLFHYKNLIGKTFNTYFCNFGTFKELPYIGFFLWPYSGALSSNLLCRLMIILILLPKLIIAEFGVIWVQTRTKIFYQVSTKMYLIVNLLNYNTKTYCSATKFY